MRYNPAKHRLPPFPGFGILLVDKPAEWTSFDVVNCLRGRFNIPKIGHCGTLDPAATGLLVLVLGKFTTLASKFSGDNKTYEATLRIGVATDSQDMTGNVIAEKPWDNITPEQVKVALKAKIGKSLQLPPMVSAVKKDGKKLYELARKGLEVERDPREIEIFSMKVGSIELPLADFTVECSKGTYVRTLCDDVGRDLGCGGALEKLRRTRCGRFELKDAFQLDELKAMEPEQLNDRLHEFLLKLGGL
ncbi:MAG: tRNA pseudouridine(55) synthase TruB [Victivallaceae bacterium]|nr:tRNA pseudouridine(55) synthase TruB [Victivallaceae bacterium]